MANCVKKIREGTDAACEGDTILFAQGTHLENVQFNGKKIVLTSTDPLDPGVVASTLIDGNRNGPASLFAGTEEETCVLSGFTITNGRPGILGRPWGHPGRATILSNVIRDGAGEDGGGLCQCDGDGTVFRNSMTENTAANGGGISHGSGTICNNVVQDNMAAVHGGGLQNLYATNTARSDLIVGNSSEKGGGLDRCSGVIENCAIVDNSELLYGGGCMSARERFKSALSGGTEVVWNATRSSMGVANRSIAALKAGEARAKEIRQTIQRPGMLTAWTMIAKRTRMTITAWRRDRRALTPGRTRTGCGTQWTSTRICESPLAILPCEWVWAPMSSFRSFRERHSSLPLRKPACDWSGTAHRETSTASGVASTWLPIPGAR